MPYDGTFSAGLPVERPGRLLWLSVGFVGGMCVLPFIQPWHTYPITSFYSEWLAFALGTVALLPLAFRRYAKPLAVPVVAFFPLAFALLLVAHVAALKSPYPQQPLLAVVYMIWTCGLIVLAALLKRAFGFERLVRILAWFVLVGGLLNGAAGVLQYYEWRGPLESVIATMLENQVYGNLGQPNHFATQIVLALVSLAALFAWKRLSLKFVIPACALLLFVLSVSASRSAWIYLIAASVIVSVAHRLERSDETRRGMVLALSLLPAFVVAQGVAALPWFLPANAHTTTIERIFQLAGTSSQRLQLWRDAWAMFLEHPVLGIGWGQFAWHNFMTSGTHGGHALIGLYNHAHNLVFDLLAETGMLGAAIIVGAWVWWAHAARKLLSSTAGIWLWSAVAILGVHSMLEYPLWNAYFLGLAGIVLGLGDSRAIPMERSRLARAGVAMFVVLAAWLSTVLVDHYYRLQTVVNSRYDANDRYALEHAHREMMTAAKSFFLTPYVELAYARDITLNTENIAEKIAFVTRVMHFAPTGMMAYRYAALYALGGDERQAQAILDRAVACYPQMLEGFEREFRAADTGDKSRHARFDDMLEERIAPGRGAAAEQSR